MKTIYEKYGKIEEIELISNPVLMFKPIKSFPDEWVSHGIVSSQRVKCFFEVATDETPDFSKISRVEYLPWVYVEGLTLSDYPMGNTSCYLTLDEAILIAKMHFNMLKEDTSLEFLTGTPVINPDFKIVLRRSTDAGWWLLDAGDYGCISIKMTDKLVVSFIP